MTLVAADPCTTHFFVACPACRTPQSQCRCDPPVMPEGGIVGKMPCPTCRMNMNAGRRTPKSAKAAAFGMDGIEVVSGAQSKHNRFVRCEGGCGRVLPINRFNTLSNSRERGGGLAGRSHKREYKTCSECTVGSVRVDMPEPKAPGRVN